MFIGVEGKWPPSLKDKDFFVWDAARDRIADKCGVLFDRDEDWWGDWLALLGRGETHS